MSRICCSSPPIVGKVGIATVIADAEWCATRPVAVAKACSTHESTPYNAGAPPPPRAVTYIVVISAKTVIPHVVFTINHLKNTQKRSGTCF